LHVTTLLSIFRIKVTMDDILYVTVGKQEPLFLSSKIISDVYVIAVNQATYTFAEKVYNIVANRML